MLTSGANASGPVQVPSLVAVSGIDVSATIAGTIGNFLATVLATSGLNSSGSVAGASGDFQSGGTVSAFVSMEGSLEVTSGIALSGTIAGTSGNFQSGINASALITTPSFVAVSVIITSGAEIAPSLIAVSNMQLSAGAASFYGSLFVQSGLQLSGTLFGSAASFTDIRTSTLTTSALLNVLASGQLQSGMSLSGQLAGTFASFTASIVTPDLFTNSATATSGINTSALVAIGGNLSAVNLNVSQVNAASGLFQSGINLSGMIQGTNASFTASFGFGSTVIISALLNVQASGTFQSGINTSGTAFATSVIVPGGGIVNSPTIFVSTTLSVTGSLYAQSGAFQSGIIASGWIKILPPTGSPALWLLPVSGNNQQIFVISVGEQASQVFAIALSGQWAQNASVTLFSGLNASAQVAGTSGIFQSGLNTSGKVNIAGGLSAAGQVTVSAITAEDGSRFSGFVSFVASTEFQSGFNTSGAPNLFVGTGQAVTIGVATGANQALAFALSIGNAGNLLAVTPSGLLSMDASATFQSGLNTSGAVNLAASVIASTIYTSYIQTQSIAGGPGGVASFGGSVIVVSGLNTSALLGIGGGARVFYVSVTATGNITPASAMIFLVDTTGASINIGLPSAATLSLAYLYVLKKSNDANSLIISAAAGDNIEGVAALSNAGAYAETRLWTPGSITWYKMLPSTGIL